jgi:NACHT domain/HEAT repeats/Restriction endonuclease
MDSATPTWINLPPDSVPCMPPVVTRNQVLPFNQLSWENFERLILRLIRQTGTISSCSIYGVQGDTQHGIDILATTYESSSLIYCQCKRVRRFSSADIKKAVRLFIGGPFYATAKELILCLTVPAETAKQVKEIENQRALLARDGIKLTIWDSSVNGTLNEKLKQAPELVDDFFGRQWVAIFNGPDAVERLGDRLDGRDSIALRSRFDALYTTLFNQHDPGPDGPTGGVAEYAHRYVAVDIYEDVSVEDVNDPRPRQDLDPGKETRRAYGDPSDASAPAATAVDASAAAVTARHRRPAVEWLGQQNHSVLLGEPGYGKSALLRNLTLGLLRADQSVTGSMSQDLLRRLPAWLPFAAFANAVTIDARVSVQDHFEDWLHRYGFDDIIPLFQRAAKTGELVLLVDGLDEASSPAAARRAFDRIATFVRATRTVIICTTRPVGAADLGIPPSWATAELAPFSDEQILEFAKRWFALCHANIVSKRHLIQELVRAQPQAEKFLQAVRASTRTHALARTPLLTRALTEMYRRSPKLPEARADVYGDIVHLLLSRHPATRDRAADHDTHSQLSSQELRNGIASLALALQSKNAVVLSTQECRGFWAAYLENGEDGLGLERSAAKRLAESTLVELVSRYAMMVERAPGELGFVHLSIQEFLAAEAIAAMPEVKQLEWVADVWKDTTQRECFLSWVGISGQRGQRALINNAVVAIKNQASSVYLGARSLELRTEIACSDLGLSLPTSRETVQEAATQLRRSPLASHRAKLASTLTIGALGSRVSDLCSVVIRNSMCARSAYIRADGIRALGQWEPTKELQEALVDLLFEEDANCRRAAAETLAALYGSQVAILSDVARIAKSDARPEVRAAALRCLASSTAGNALAIAAACVNEVATHPDLLIEVFRVYVREGRQADAHLETLLRIFAGGAIDFSLRQDFFDLLHHGWPGAMAIRAAFIAGIHDHFTSYEGRVINYLIRAFPGDQEIAALVVNELAERGIGSGFESGLMLPLLAEHFPHHTGVATAVRDALREVEEKYPGMQWHPRYIDAYVFFGDNSTRDYLCRSYVESDSTLDRSWIAKALWEGWKSDEAAKSFFRKWINGPIDMSLPLAPWLLELVESPDEKRRWLEEAIRVGDSHGVTAAIRVYLDEFPDELARDRVWARLAAADLWYYAQIEIEATLAGLAPSDTRSLQVIKRSVAQLDGPPLAPWIASTTLTEEQRSMALSALRPAAAGIRMAIASTLAARAPSYRDVVDLVPGYLAEERGSVRTTVMLALADLSKSSVSEAAPFRDVVVAEAKSIGSMMDSRRLTALACLLELGNPDDLAAVVTESHNASFRLSSPMDPDPVAYAAIAKNWFLFRSTMHAAKGATDDALASLIGSGAIANISDQGGLADDVDAMLAGHWDDWDFAAYATTYVSRRPQRDVLARRLIKELARSTGRRGQTVAARMLAQRFGGDPKVLQLLKNAFDASDARSRYWWEGTIGYLAVGWPQAFHLRHEDLNACDAVLVHSAQGDIEKATLAAQSLLRDHYRNMKFNSSEREILRSWARIAGTAEVLSEWAHSDDATLSMTGVSLLVAGGHGDMLDRDRLVARLNNEFANSTPPIDGLNGATGELIGWAVSVYASLET